MLKNISILFKSHQTLVHIKCCTFQDIQKALNELIMMISYTQRHQNINFSIQKIYFCVTKVWGSGLIDPYNLAEIIFLPWNTYQSYGFVLKIV